MPPTCAFATIEQARFPKPIELQLLVQLAGEPTCAPLPRPKQLHCVQAHLDAITLGVLGNLTVGGKQRKLRALLRVFIERLNHPAPSRALARVDLAQIQHLALDYSAIGAALGFDDVPVAVLLAVF